MDRAYFVKVRGKYEEIKMPAVLVKVLLELNEKDNRKDIGMDQPFVKAIIIGICTIKVIRQNEPIDKDLLIFIKAIFQ